MIAVDAAGDDANMRIDVVIVAGQYKGEVVTIVSKGETQDEIEVLGSPGQLVVDASGSPHILW